MRRMGKGYIQVYTGEGKGKTTAALGLSLRAAGAGLKVFIAQFVKKKRCSEHKIIAERLGDLITIRRYGAGLIRQEKTTEADAEGARKGLKEVMLAMESGEYQLVILDEVNVAVHYGLVALSELIDIMEKKGPDLELVITGRYAEQAVIDKADLVTEMREVKHYWRKGIKARRGIEW